MFNLLVFLFIFAITKISCDFPFGKIDFNQGDEVAASVFIPGQKRAIVVLATRYPSTGFHLGLYDLDSCSIITPSGNCAPALLAGFFERDGQVNMRPDIYPQVFWIGEADNRFILTGYKRKENPSCLLKQFTVGTDFNTITEVVPNVNINCNGDFPSQPDVLAWFTPHNKFIYYKDYDNAPANNWQLRCFNAVTNTLSGSIHVLPNEAYVLGNNPRNGVGAMQYMYYVPGDGFIQFKQLNLAFGTPAIPNMPIRTPSVQQAIMLQYSDHVAVMHLDHMLFVYDYTGAIQAEFYFQHYFPNLEAFKSVLDENGAELIMVASQLGQDRFIRWIQTTPTYKMHRGHVMERNDLYNYNYQNAIAYDAAQNFLMYMTIETRFSFVFSDNCQHGYMTVSTGSCTDAICAIGCLSCDAGGCIVCREGYTFDDNYVCQFDAARGVHVTHDDKPGVFLGFDGGVRGSFFKDNTGNDDLMVSFDTANKHVYKFVIETQALLQIDLSATIPVFDINSYALLHQSEYLVTVEHDTATPQYYIRRRIFSNTATTVGADYITPNRPSQITHYMIQDPNPVDKRQFFAFIEDDSVANQFYVMNADNAARTIITTANNLDKTTTEPIFFTGVLNFAGPTYVSIVMVQAANSQVEIFYCDSMVSPPIPTPPGPPNCYADETWGPIGQIRLVQIDQTNVNRFIRYSVGDTNLDIIELTQTFATPTLAVAGISAPYALPSPLREGQYISNKDQAIEYHIFVSLQEDGTITVTALSATFNSFTHVRTIYGYKYWDRTIPNVVTDNFVYTGYVTQIATQKMTLIIKSESTMQMINLCGINGFYDVTLANRCQTCNAWCLKCKATTVNDCFLCVSVPTPKYLQGSSCVDTCINTGEYGDGRFNECRPCDHQCLSCVNASNQCTACRGNRINPWVIGTPHSGTTCVCPAGLWDDGVSTNCDPCDPAVPTSCEECIDYVCTDCVENMVNNDQNNLCECDVGDYTNPDPFFTQICTTCLTAPYTAILDDDLEIITIEFFTPIQFIDFDKPKFELNQDEWTYELCVHAIQQVTLDQLGEVPKCRRNGLTQIQIQFGYLPTLIAPGTGSIQFTHTSINRPTCPANQFFNDFPVEPYADAPNPADPDIKLEGPSIVTICEEFDVYAFSEELDGLRGINTIVWGTTDLQPNVLDVMTYYTNQQTHYFTMPALTLLAGTTYQFSFTFQNYQGRISTVSITINTYAQTEGPHIRMLQRNFLSYFQQDTIKIEAELNYIRCDAQTGEIEYLNDRNYKTTWQLYNSPVLSDLEVVLDNPNQFISYTFQPWSLATKDQYGIRLLSDVDGVIAQQQLNFNVREYPELMCYIQGGNRIHSVDKDLLIDAKVLNLDVATALQDTGITYVWDCKLMTDFSACLNAAGTTITFGNSANILIPANTLKGYQSLKFRVVASITTPTFKRCIYEVVITLTQLIQPLQLFKFPEHVMTYRINLNDVFKPEVSLESSLNPDQAWYNIAFYYKDVEVGQVTKYYTEYTIRLMDYFENLIVTDPYVTLKISVQSPYEYMPSHTTLRLLVNYPPQNGVLLVAPGTGGESGLTVFTFQADQWTDSDQDIMYRFSYYLSEALFEQDKVNGYNPLMSEQNIIQDFSPRSICQTMLPLPIPDENKAYNIVVMVEAADLKGGKSNRTNTIQVARQNKPRTTLIGLLDTQYRNAHKEVVEKRLNQFIILAQELRQLDELGTSECGGNGSFDIIENKCLCFNGFYMRDCSYTLDEYTTYAKLKMELYTSIKDLRDKMLRFVYEEQSTKSMTALLDDHYIGLLLNTTFMDSYISDQDSYINQKILNKISELQTNNKVYQATFNFDNEVDSIFRVMKNTYFSIDSVAYAINNTEFYGRAQGSFTEFQRLKYYKQLVNLTRDASTQIHILQLPNDLVYDLKGKMFNNQISVRTSKQVLRYVLDADIEIDQVDFTTDLYDVEGDGVFHVYDVMKQGYQVNPYQHEPTFPYPEQDTKSQDVDVFRRGVPDVEITPNVRVRYQFEPMNKANHTWNKCLTRRYNGIWLPPTWTNEDCETQYIKQANDNYDIICTCFALNPVSVVDDYLCLFRDCFPEPEGFKWYYSLMLYVQIVFFVTFCYFLYKAFVYDRAQMYKVTMELEDEENESDSEEEQEKLAPDRLKVGNVFEYLEGSRRGKIKRHKKRDTNNEGEEINVHDRGGRTEVDVDQIEDLDEYKEVYFRQNVCYAIYKLHELLSVYFFFDTVCRRVFRLMFWYSKGLMFCAFIGILLQEEETLENVVWYSIIFVLVYDFLIGCMKFLMRRKEFMLRLLGFNLGLAGLIFGSYFIIVNDHWHFLLKSNYWAYVFLMLYFGDTFGLQPTLIVLKTMIINAAIGKGHKIALFIKWLFIFWEENILFRNLLKDARNIFG